MLENWNLSVDFLKEIRNTLILEIIGLKSEHKEVCVWKWPSHGGTTTFFHSIPQQNICHAIKSPEEQLFWWLLGPRFTDKYYKYYCQHSGTKLITSTSMIMDFSNTVLFTFPHFDSMMPNNLTKMYLSSLSKPFKMRIINHLEVYYQFQRFCPF